MLLGAIWATGLAGYGSFPAILAEARLFQLAARFNGTCSGSFLPLLGCETYALWRDVCSRGLGGGLALGDVRSGFGSFALMGACVACVSGLREGEGELEGTTYCTRVRGNPLNYLGGAFVGGSIPARAGEPEFDNVWLNNVRVYPRACGGTSSRPCSS